MRPFRIISYEDEAGRVFNCSFFDNPTKMHEWLEWLQENGSLPIIQASMVAYLAMNFLRWLVYRVTDGIWPSERAIAKRDRELAASYKKRHAD